MDPFRVVILASSRGLDVARSENTGMPSAMAKSRRAARRAEDASVKARAQDVHDNAIVSEDMIAEFNRECAELEARRADLEEQARQLTVRRLEFVQNGRVLFNTHGCAASPSSCDERDMSEGHRPTSGVTKMRASELREQADGARKGSKAESSGPQVVRAREPN